MTSPKISFCLISRDNEKTIRNTLESIKNIADEIIVVDTGSKDKTCEIIKEYTDKLYHFQWIDDFSAARNESVKYAKNDWIFIIDTDEVLGKDPKKLISEAISWADANGYTAIACQIINHVQDKVESMNFMERLFRKGLSKTPFIGVIHERLAPEYQGAKYNLTIDHFGYDQKLNLNHKDEAIRQNMIEKDYQRDTKDLNALRNLFRFYLDQGSPEKALALLPLDGAEHKELLLIKAEAYADLHKDQEALATLVPLLQTKNSKWLDLRPYLLYGQLLCRAGRNKEAYTLYKAVFNFRVDDLTRQSANLFNFQMYFLSLMQASYLAADNKEYVFLADWIERLLKNGYYAEQAISLLRSLALRPEGKEILQDLQIRYPDKFKASSK